MGYNNSTHSSIHQTLEGLCKPVAYAGFFSKAGGGGFMIDAAPGLKKLMSGGGGGTPTLFSDFKIFGSIFQTQSRGTHRTSPTSLTSKKKRRNSQIQRGGGGFEPHIPFPPPPPHHICLM